MIENVNSNLSQANDYVDNVIFSTPNNISKKILQHIFETSNLSYFFYSNEYNYSNIKYIQDYFRSFMTSNNQLKNISIYYDNNKYLISPSYNGRLSKNEYEKQFEEILTDSSYKDPFYWIYVSSSNIFSNTNYNANTMYSNDIKYLYFIRKIPSVAFSTKHGGAIIISMNESVFYSEIRNFFPSNTEVFLVSLDGTIIFSSNKSYVLNNLTNFGINIDRISTNKSQGNFIENINEINTLISYKKSSYSNYMFISFTPIDGITSNFAILLKLFAIVTLLTFILGIILSLYSVKIYSAPLIFLKNICTNILKKYSPEENTKNEYEIINNTVDMLSNKLNEQENSIKEVSPLLYEHILVSLINNNSNTSAKINNLRIADINFNKDSYIIAVFKIKYDNSLITGNSIKSPEYMYREITEIINHFFVDKNIEHINSKINNNLVFLFNLGCNNSIMQIFQCISEHMTKFTGVHVYIGVSDRCNILDNIGTIYKHACKTLNYSFIYPDKKILCYDLIVMTKKEYPIIVEQCIKQMIAALHCHSLNNFNSLIDKLHDSVYSGDYLYEDIMSLLENFVSFIYNYSKEYNIILDKTYKIL